MQKNVVKTYWLLLITSCPGADKAAQGPTTPFDGFEHRTASYIDTGWTDTVRRAWTEVMGLAFDTVPGFLCTVDRIHLNAVQLRRADVIGDEPVSPWDATRIPGMAAGLP